MHQIRYFLAVADELNFTRAADKCHVAQPSLTRAVKLLEEELGGALFHRERANTHLTELGRSVRPHLQDALVQSDAAKHIAHNFKTLKKLNLKLGVMCTIAPAELVGLIGAVQTRHPGVEVEMVDASARELNDKLLDGEIDVAIYCLPTDEVSDKLLLRPLFCERMMIVLHPAHRLAMRNAIRVADLDGERYVNRARCEFRGYVGAFFKEQGVNCEVVFRSERDDWVLAMIASGQGFGFMPENCVSNASVVTRPLIDPEIWREVNLVTVRGRPHSPAVAALVKEATRIGWKGDPTLPANAPPDSAVVIGRAAPMSAPRPDRGLETASKPS
ncbi:LysR family transcriptional regulator [Rhodoblastus sp. 17X3]|uniref:LysR family transcriptional regulator n=1 Tax=Rhodoblastus sp. 17X3 TaxID=3047026 RepID=UPI0024B6A601|nr:LysR family transcriptional regulator [Rhodoblastus sp. 17X3]MDI9849646.1 LysR family transcriptional regulator [Rhodoblastus sp. 17X3]